MKTIEKIENRIPQTAEELAAFAVRRLRVMEDSVMAMRVLETITDIVLARPQYRNQQDIIWSGVEQVLDAWRERTFWPSDETEEQRVRHNALEYWNCFHQAPDHQMLIEDTKRYLQRLVLAQDTLSAISDAENTEEIINIICERYEVSSADDEPTLLSALRS